MKILLGLFEKEKGKSILNNILALFIQKSGLF